MRSSFVSSTTALYAGFGCTETTVAFGCAGMAVAFSCAGMAVAFSCAGMAAAFGCAGMAAAFGCAGMAAAAARYSLSSRVSVCWGCGPAGHAVLPAAWVESAAVSSLSSATLCRLQNGTDD